MTLIDQIALFDKTRKRLQINVLHIDLPSILGYATVA